MKVLKTPALIFLFIGLAIFVGGGFWLKSTVSFISRASQITGEIAKQVEDTCERDSGSGKNKHKVSYTCYQPFVKYEFQGQVKEAGMSERSSSTYDIGSKVELLVDPSSPGQPEFKGAGLWLGPVFLLCFGAVFALVGFFLLRSVLKKEKMVKDLQVNGQIVTGKVTFSGPDMTTTINGRHPFKVEASWVHPGSGQVYVAKTQEELWHDPAQTGQFSADGEVQVKYNPNQPDQCMVMLGAVVTHRKAG